MHSENKTGDGIKSHLQAVLVVDITESQFVQSHDFKPWISVCWSIKYEGGLLDWLFVLEEQFYKGYSSDIKLQKLQSLTLVSTILSSAAVCFSQSHTISFPRYLAYFNSVNYKNNKKFHSQILGQNQFHNF